MTPKMTSDFVRAQIEKSLELLASSAAEQRKYVERPGSPVSVDELALTLEDFIVMVPAAVRDGVLSKEQANAIQQVSDFTGSFSGEQNAALWELDQLDTSWEWNEVRRLARAALQMLRGRPLE